MESSGHYAYRRVDDWRFFLPNLDNVRKRLLAPTTPQYWMEHEVLNIVGNLGWPCKSDIASKIQTDMRMYDHHHSQNGNRGGCA